MDDLTPGWLSEERLVRLPCGARVRGRPLRLAVSPADFALVLAEGPLPPWPSRRIRWPDFWIPLDTDDAVQALREALDVARRGLRVEVACRGGIGRTGTALAVLAVLDGLPPGAAAQWVRREYHRKAIETPWQRRWLRRVASAEG